MEHYIIGRRADADEPVRPIVLDRCPFKALVEIRRQDRRNPALVKDLSERDVAPGRRNVRGIDELLEEFSAIALNAEQVVDSIWVKVGCV